MANFKILQISIHLILFLEGIMLTEAEEIIKVAPISYSNFDVSSGVRRPMVSFSSNTTLPVSFTPINFKCDGIFYDEDQVGFAPFWDSMDDGVLDLGVNGSVRVAVTLSNTHSLYKARLPDGKLADIYGSSNIGYAYLLDLQDIFNFTIEIVESNGWITPGQNDTVTGAGHQVATGQADISIDVSKPVPYRAMHLTFLHSIKQDRIAIMFRQPKVQIYRNLLSNGLWKGVIACWVVLFLATLLTGWRSRKLSFSEIEEALVPVTATILARGVNMSSFLRGCDRKSLRMVILVASFFGLTMYSIYSAFIVSSLRRAQSPVRKFKHLINYDYELLAQHSLPDFTNVYVQNRKIGNYYAEKARKNFISIEDSLRRLFAFQNSNQEGNDGSPLDLESNPSVAWFALKSDFAYYAVQHGYTAQQICEISQLEPVIRAEHPRILSMFINKNNSKMKEHFNRRILDILERGLGQRHVLQFESEFLPKCGSDLRRTIQINKIRFFDVYVAYMLLFGGVLISIGIWVIGEKIIPYLWKTGFILRNRQRYRVYHARGEITMVESSNLSKSGLGNLDLELELREMPAYRAYIHELK